MLATSIFFLLTLAMALSSTYKVSSTFSNSSHIILSLQYTGSEDYYIKKSSPIYKNLTFTLACLSFSDLTFLITDSANQRYRIPNYPPFPVDPLTKSSFPLNLSLFNVTYNQDPFELKITRNPGGEVLFDSTGRNLVFS